MMKKTLAKGLNGLFILICLVYSSAGLSAGFEIEGSLSPDLTNSPYMTLQITVLNINSVEKEGTFLDLLGIILLDSDSRPIQVVEGGNDSAGNIGFYWSRANTVEPVPVQLSTDNYKLVFSNIVVRQNTIGTPGSFAKILKDGKIRVVVSYDGEKSREVEVQQEFAIPSSAPANLELRATTAKAISVSWTAEESSAHSDGKNRPVGEVMVALVAHKELSSSSVNLDAAALQSTLSGEADQQGACTFTLPTDSGAPCVNCPADNTFLDAEKLKAIPGFSRTVVSANSGSFSFTNLDESDTYTVFLQYPRGSQRSGCYNIKPILDQTLSEASGEDDAKATDRRCFIATAAYGSQYHPNLDHFWWFRDRVLLSLPWGQSLVETYYDWSPSLAASIEQSPRAQSVISLLLWIPTFFIILLRWISQSPEVWVLGIAIGFGFWRWKTVRENQRI
jgi:hypothetical protein